jgi:branched-chain amino acid transport system substrate-binding protein
MTTKTTKSGSISRRRLLATASAGAAVLGLTSRVGAQQPPIKIGMSMAQTGGLAGGGKASLLGIEI